MSNPLSLKIINKIDPGIPNNITNKLSGLSGSNIYNTINNGDVINKLNTQYVFATFGLLILIMIIILCLVVFKVDFTNIFSSISYLSVFLFGIIPFFTILTCIWFLPFFKESRIFITMCLLIILIIIAVSTFLSLDFSTGLGYFSIFFFIALPILIIVGLINFLPIFKNLKTFLFEIQSSIYLIIYTILLIWFFQHISYLGLSSVINEYPLIFNVVSIALTSYVFFNAYKSRNSENFNANYERIRMIIIFFCLITVTLLYYLNDPGGYVAKYFGSLLVLSSVLFIFIILYIIILLSFSNKNNNSTPDKKVGFDNLLNNFSIFSRLGTIGYVIFLVSVCIYLFYALKNKTPATNIGGLNTEPVQSIPGQQIPQLNASTVGTIIVFTLLISILWGSLLIINLFSDTKKNPAAESNKFKLFRSSLLLLFGIIILALIISWVAYAGASFTSSYSSITSIILNCLLVIIFLVLIYRIIIVDLPYGNRQKNATFDLLINLIFYIPCLFSDAFDYIMKIFISEYNNNTTGTYLILLIAIILLVLFYVVPIIYQKINLQGGKLLVNEPVYLNSSYALGTYQDLTGSDVFEYQYAISFWFYLDAAAPQNSDHFYSIINFGNKPNVTYNGYNNQLMITMEVEKVLNIDFPNSPPNITTPPPAKIVLNELPTLIYDSSYNNVLLQKWNNMIINYNGGTMDIFLNGELIKSVPGVISYYTLDNLTIGENNGTNGGICNVVYYNKALTLNNIYFIYNLLKNSTPPVVENNNYTIVKQKINNSYA
jgi:hypothetical protein